MVAVTVRVGRTVKGVIERMLPDVLRRTVQSQGVKNTVRTQKIILMACSSSVVLKEVLFRLVRAGANIGWLRQCQRRMLHLVLLGAAGYRHVKKL